MPGDLGLIPYETDIYRRSRIHAEGYACQAHAIRLGFVTCLVTDVGGGLAVLSQLLCRWSAGRPQTLDKIRLRECNSSGTATIGDRLIGNLLAKLSLAATEILSRLLYAVKAGRAMSATLRAVIRGFQSASTALS